MAYLGSPPASQFFAPGTDTFSGTGSQTAFTLSRNVATVNDIQVVVNNVVQQPSNYTVASNILTFSPAPSAGTDNIYVRYLSTNLTAIVPQQGSVTPASLSTPNAVYWDTSGNVGVGTTAPTGFGSPDLHINGTNPIVHFTTPTTGTASGDGTQIGQDDVNFDIVNFEAGKIGFWTSVAERMRIDSSGNVGIGIISTNGFWGSTNTDAKVNIAYSSSGTTFDTAIKGLVLQNTNTTTSNTTSLIFGSQNTGGTGIAQAAIYSINGTRGGAFNSGQLGFSYANSSGVLTEAMRLDSSGRLLVGVTSTNSGTNLVLSTNGSTQWWTGPYNSAPNNFYISGNSLTNGVYLNGVAATAWSALSDERAKDIIEPIENAIEKVNTLRAVIGKYKTDEENTRKVFLIAQDVQAVLPEAVSVANPETGHLGLAYTDVIPLLVAAIKEQQAMIEELKAKVAALEAR